MTQEALSQLIECARLLGQTQAKKALSIYTEQDSRFEVAMYKSIHEHKAKIKEALAQTQEPVAEIVSDTFGCLSTKWRDEWTPNEGDKLYTTPPKRTWVGLTDEDEIPWDGVDAKSFARAIEAKLKEKNT
jgi:hypothetical protein